MSEATGEQIAEELALARIVRYLYESKTGKRSLADPDSAEQIVVKYVHQENEPSSVSAGGSDAAGEGVSPPDPAQVQSNWGSDA